jgi:copper chaperone CopZ
VSVAIKKLEGVESIDVSLEKSSADIKLKPRQQGHTGPDPRSIRSNGYPPRTRRSTRRKVRRTGRKAGLRPAQRLRTDLAEQPKDAPADAVDITGVSRPGDKDAERLTITAIKK